MSIVPIRAAASRPTIGDLVSRATAIGAFVREQAEQTEANRKVPAETIARMREAGLFRVMQPAVYGGYEYGFDALAQIVAPIGAGCGSTGWIFSLYITHQWLTA